MTRNGKMSHPYRSDSTSSSASSHCSHSSSNGNHSSNKSVIYPSQGSSDDDTVTLYVRAGCDNLKYGACPFCQRVFMVLMVKAAGGPLKFRVATVPKTGLPEEFKEHGLRNLPALIHRDEALDTVEEMIDYIESEFPLPRLAEDTQEAERVTRNFFSKFCYYIKAVSKDSSALEVELRRLDDLLSRMPQNRGGPFLGGDQLSHLDCEIMPKLHHLRVAGQRLKRFEIPASYTGLWRYLHGAYSSCPEFARACPPDSEIILHWADRPDVPRTLLKAEDRRALARQQSGGERFSFDVPAVAVPITL